jgi:XTP/dITP diphosphohydrolase
LAYAAKVLGKAGVASIDVETEGDDDEIGAELLRIVARAREAGVDPEAALRRTAARFVERFREHEADDGMNEA